MNKETGFVNSGNASLYYELAGEGQALVFIHAGVADSRQWNHEFERFAQDYRVLRYDLRGFGKSNPLEGEFSHLGDLMAVLDQLGLDQPVALIGCSMGGSLAMDFALEHPDRVKALVMVGSGPSGLRLDVPGHSKEAEAEKAYSAGELDLVAELETQIWFDGMGRTPQEVNADMRMLAKEMNRLGLLHDSKGLGKLLPNTITPAAERLAELEIPVLVVVGEHDLPYSHAAADYIVANASNARKVILEDTAHLANLDHPERFQSAVQSFLHEINAPGRQ